MTLFLHALFWALLFGGSRPVTDSDWRNAVFPVRSSLQSHADALGYDGNVTSLLLLSTPHDANVQLVNGKLYTGRILLEDGSTSFCISVHHTFRDDNATLVGVEYC